MPFNFDLKLVPKPIGFTFCKLLSAYCFPLIFILSTRLLFCPIVDKWLNCIQVFNKEGVYERQIGVKGTSPGHFRSPEGIAVDSKGYIYVCDTCNDRVQVSQYKSLSEIVFSLLSCSDETRKLPKSRRERSNRLLSIACNGCSIRNVEPNKEDRIG